MCVSSTIFPCSGDWIGGVLATLSIHVGTGSDDGRLRRPRVFMVEPAEDRKPDDVAIDLRD